MKTINITFTDGEYRKLRRIKGELNWHDMILAAASYVDRSGEWK